jgi:hypothetical protein
MDTQELIKYCKSQLPENMKARPWDVTDHGRAILQTEDQLNAYIAAYGEMHFSSAERHCRIFHSRI